MAANIVLTQNTIDYALDILNRQAEYIETDSRHSKVRREKQLSYYQGMHAMLSLLVQQAYTDDRLILNVTADNKHFICEREKI